MPHDFEKQGIFMEEGNTGPAFMDANSKGTRLMSELKEKIKQYNAQHSTAPIPVAHTALDAPANMVGRYSNYTILNTITQLQLYVASAPHGSGTAFRLLPAENATGNFVKVVQRVPVKISIEDVPKDLVLGPGLSVIPSVRVR